MAKKKRVRQSQKKLLGRFLGGDWKRGPYKPKNQLDVFLKDAVGGKYKWRRYEIYKDYLRGACGCSDAQADEIVKDRMAHGFDMINMVEQMVALQNWLKEFRKKRAQNAAAVRHTKLKNNS